MTKHSRTSSGKYSVAGKIHDMLIGTRAQVWHGTAYKKTGGLTKNDLMKNKSGRIVSKAKHNTAKREKRLVKAGFLTKKGQFGFIKDGKSMKKRRGRKGSRKMRGGMSPLRPSEFNGWKVPEVLLSGNDELIEKWREDQALLRTQERRPDLLKKGREN